MSKIDNLWQFDVDQAKYMTPKRVMQAQANYLNEMSSNRLVVSLKGRQGTGIRDDSSIHEFQVGITSPFDYQCTFFEVHQTMDIYPLQVVSGLDRNMAQECSTLDEFIDALREILNAPVAQRRLAALYSQACDELVGEGDTLPPKLVGDNLESLSETDTAAVTLTSPAESEVPSTPVEEASATVGSEIVDGSSEEQAVFPGWTSVAEINKQFGLSLDTYYEDISTCIEAEIGSRPMAGTRIEKGEFVIEVISMSGTSVGEVLVYAKR